MKEFSFGLIVYAVVATAFGLTYITKLRKENRTKEIAIIGLKEIIRLLEKKKLR